LTIIAIIPARKGSKGLLGKNLRDFCGKPLIVRAIETALQSQSFDAVYVTSDDDEILELVTQNSVSVIKRPAKLANDEAGMIDVVKHVYSFLTIKGLKSGDAFCLLQPTSPLRSKLHISEAVKLFKESEVSSVVSVTEVDEIPEKMLHIENDCLIPAVSWNLLHKNRQQLPKSYKQNGAIWITKWDDFLSKSTFAIPPCKPYYMSIDESIDIDNISDFLYAESIYNKY